MKKNKVFCIYKHISPSGKAYIGQTNDYRKRCGEHKRSTSGCAVFKKAVERYGWDNFKHEILLTGLTVEEANQCEVIAIKLHNTRVPHGYNLAEGGRSKCGVPHSPETKEKMRQAHLGKKKSPEHIEKLRQVNKGKKQTPEWMEMMKQVHLGRKNSPETIEKMRQAKLGKKRTTEAIEKQKAATNLRKNVDVIAKFEQVQP